MNDTNQRDPSIPHLCPVHIILSGKRVLEPPRCAVPGVTRPAAQVGHRPILSHLPDPSASVLAVPESPSAVLALVPNPAGEAGTVAGRRVALPVQTRLIALLRLGDAEQPDGREQQRRRQHQQAPAGAGAGAGARAGPLRRPVHSLTKDGCFEVGAPLLRRGSGSTSRALTGFRRAEPR